MTDTTTPLSLSTAVAPDAAYSIADAAVLTGFSHDTIKRDRTQGHFPSAYQLETGRRDWMIPVGDLVAAGRLPADRIAERVADLEALKESRAMSALREQFAESQLRIARLETELAAAVQRASAAEVEKATWQRFATDLMKKVA